MNAAEIRAEAIERVAKAMCRQSMPTAPGLDVLPEPIRAAIYQRAEHAVDALGDLLPTHSYDEVCGGFQYGAGYTLDEHPPTFTSRRYWGTASLDDNAEHAAYVQWHRDRGRLTIEELLQISSGEAR